MKKVFIIIFIALISYIFGFVVYEPSVDDSLLLGAGEVTIDTSLDDATYADSPNGKVVFIDDNNGYAFYSGLSGDLHYRKSTDGGATWGAEQVFANESGGSQMVRFGLWYDRWTPGDDTGTKIYVAYSDQGTDDLFYNYLDTSGDTIGTSVLVKTSLSYSETYVAPSITKSTDGYLFIFWAEWSEEFVMKSTDSGSSWAQTSATFLDASDDPVLLLPLSGGDIILIQHDVSVDDLVSRVYDEATDSWDSSDTVIDTTFNNIAGTRSQFGGAVYRSTGDVYVVGNNGVSTYDVQSYLYSESTRTWSNKTDVVSNDNGLLDAKIAIDDNNGDVYVIYGTYGTGFSSNVNVYYKKSTDGMTTWSAETQLNVTTDDIRYLGTTLTSDEYLYAVWHNDDLNDILGATIADITPSSPPPAVDNPNFQNIIWFD